jgi:uncharacterized protein (DUF169 family)
MDSKIASSLHLKHQPVALLWTNDRPDEALQFHPDKWGCVMAMFAQAATGKTAVFDRQTFGCIGGGVGLGFGNQYVNWRGGIECFYGFLSNGNAERENASEIAEQIARTGRKVAVERFLHGEGLVKSPELAKVFVDSMPMVDIPDRYVVFKPLSSVDELKEQPQVVIFPVNADQLSALVSLANYDRGTLDAVIIQPVAGCQSIGILVYKEAMSARPRAVIGLTDIAARTYTAPTLGHDILTFSVPLKLFREMESNVEGGFLEKETWHSLIAS